jgi:proteasome lid subunit RPN8/RPN11
LLTPVYLKTDPAEPWPEQEPVFYLLTADGLMLCRNHAFFRSSVPAPAPPQELAGQKPFLQLRYPKVPQQLLEQVVGFFDRVERQHGSEAAVLLAWDTQARTMVPVVPEQVGSVSYGYQGDAYPIDLHYQIPPLPGHCILIGDVHSHGNGGAYTSATDRDDERFRPGIHLVVGRIRQEPPEFHCEVIADGFRFLVKDLAAVAEGYRTRRCREVPRAWMDRVSAKPWTAPSIYGASSYASSSLSAPGAPSWAPAGPPLAESDPPPSPEPPYDPS